MALLHWEDLTEEQKEKHKKLVNDSIKRLSGMSFPFVAKDFDGKEVHVLGPIQWFPSYQEPIRLIDWTQLTVIDIESRETSIRFGTQLFISGVSLIHKTPCPKESNFEKALNATLKGVTIES